MQSAGLILIAHQDSLGRAMDVLANNIANINTTGFKRENVAFETLVSQPEEGDRSYFATDKGTYRDTAQGPVLTTGSPLDLAIQGKGYFPIQTQEGTRYTRGGSFQLNAAGEIVTASGDKLLGDGEQPITVPENAEDLHIGADGIVSVKSGAGSSVTELGRIRLVRFEREQAMQILGNGLYKTEESPQPDPESRLVQGAVERSNVQPVIEMTRMIEITRSYQSAFRLLDLDNQRQNSAISRLARASA